MPRQYVMPGTLTPHEEAAINLWLYRHERRDVRAKRKLAEQRACATLDKEIEGLNRAVAEASDRVIVYSEDRGGPLAVPVPFEYDDAAVTRRGKQTVVLFEIQETVKNHAKRVEIENDPDPIVKKRLKMTEHSATPRLVPDEPEVTEEAPPRDGTPAGEPVSEPSSDVAGELVMPATEYVEIPDCGRVGCKHSSGDHVGGANEGACARAICLCEQYQAPGPTDAGAGSSARKAGRR